jgi:hypothetical protein
VDIFEGTAHVLERFGFPVMHERMEGRLFLNAQEGREALDA